ncbi:site-specific integrase [Winogradskyella tangerina]|uniref:site-specific integrase n=1 Tax=Winogradskyella tangerina TaxID=2023240 RepID=UPI000DBE1D4F|nr:site-specific integrase [Winogradskyella tangerina]
MTKTIKLTSGTAKYRLKEPNAKKETSIILDYSFGRNNRIKFSTGYKVNPKYWDDSNQRIRAISTIENRESVNADLAKYLAEFVKETVNLDDVERTNKSILKSLLQKIIRGEQKDVSIPKSFFQYADSFILRKESLSKSITSAKLSPVTVRSYKQTVNRLRDFSNELGYSLDFNTIDLDFYYEFIKYLEKNNYTTNTIGKHIKNLKTILNSATEEGYNSSLKYKHREFKALSEDTVSIYLTEEEIDAIYDVDLSKTKDWELARDIFLVGYYTGQRVSDYNPIVQNQIKKFQGTEVIEFKQKKTSKKLFVPLHPKLKKIFKDRYGGNPPPELNAPDINEFIKEVGRKAKIDSEIPLERKMNGKVIEHTVPKYSLIQSHTARRSFCTNAYLTKMPVIDIMAISGHSTEREFYKYIKVTPQERAVKIADSKFFR